MPLFGLLDRLGLLADQAGEPAQTFAQGVLHDLRLPDAAVAVVLLVEPVADVVEILAGAVVAVDHLPLGLLSARPDQQPLVGTVVVEPPQGEFDLAVSEPQAQVVAGHRFQRVGLVEDDDVVPRQHAAGAVDAQSQIGEIQGVVDDEDLGVAHPPPRPIVEAIGVAGALAAHAVGRIAGDFLPHGGQGLVGQVGQRAVAGLARPRLNLAELLVLFLLVEEADRSSQGVFHPPQAEVVVAALDQHGGKLDRHHAPQKRDVLGEQLLLETDGVRGDDHPPGRRFLVAGLGLFPGGQNGRHEVGEALAHPRSGLDHQVMAIFNSIGHGVGHGQLFVAMFVVGQPRGDAARRPEDFGRSEHPLSLTGEGGGGRREVRPEASLSNPAWLAQAEKELAGYLTAA